MQAGRPRRTIRVVLFGAEEVGGVRRRRLSRRPPGRRTSCSSPNPISAPTGSGGSISSFAPANAALADRIAALLAPLGIVARPRPRRCRRRSRRLGRAPASPAIDLQQDGTRYFDYHHTPDDTLDKVDPEQLRQNVAAWTAMLAAVADAPEEIEPRKRPRLYPLTRLDLYGRAIDSR